MNAVLIHCREVWLIMAVIVGGLLSGVGLGWLAVRLFPSIFGPVPF